MTLILLDHNKVQKGGEWHKGKTSEKCDTPLFISIQSPAWALRRGLHFLFSKTKNKSPVCGTQFHRYEPFFSVDTGLSQAAELSTLSRSNGKGGEIKVPFVSPAEKEIWSTSTYSGDVFLQESPHSWYVRYQPNTYCRSKKLHNLHFSWTLPRRQQFWYATQQNLLALSTSNWTVLCECILHLVNMMHQLVSQTVALAYQRDQFTPA